MYFESQHEHTTLFPTSCSKKYELFILCLLNFSFSKKMSLSRSHDEYWAVNLVSLAWIPYQTQKVAGHVIFQSMA